MGNEGNMRIKLKFRFRKDVDILNTGTCRSEAEFPIYRGHLKTVSAPGKLAENIGRKEQGKKDQNDPFYYEPYDRRFSFFFGHVFGLFFVFMGYSGTVYAFFPRLGKFSKTFFVVTNYCADFPVMKLFTVIVVVQRAFWISLRHVGFPFFKKPDNYRVLTKTTNRNPIKTGSSPIQLERREQKPYLFRGFHKILYVRVYCL